MKRNKATQAQVMAVNDAKDAGAIVYWSMAGGIVIDDLEAAWSAAGFGNIALPEPPKPHTACARAVNEEAERRLLSRPLEGRKGRALVDEKAKDRDLDYKVKVTATVDAIGRIDVQTEDEELKARIEKAYQRHLMSELSTDDISSWITRTLMTHVDGLNLKPQVGGFYFVPREHVPTWQRMVDAIRAASNHAFYTIPATTSEAAVESILASLTTDAKATADGMWEALAEGKLGGRALDTQTAACVALKEKIGRYESLLGAALPELHDTLGKLSANLSAAALRAHEGESYSDLADLAELV